jgi:hypothetical protein
MRYPPGKLRDILPPRSEYGAAGRLRGSNVARAAKTQIAHEHVLPLLQIASEEV